MRRHWVVAAVGIAVLGTGWGLWHGRHRCGDAYRRYKLDFPRCPSGKVLQTARLDVSGLRRGAKASVRLSAQARYTVQASDAVQSMPLPGVGKIALSLVDGGGKATPLPVTWKETAGGAAAQLEVPDVPDGDYKLHAAFETGIGKGEVDAPVPLYSPARIHVITDRPLYEPGNTVRFRAVVLRARDLAPLDGRPGTWFVYDPSGEVVLEEKAPAGDWGVVAGKLPLDRAAPTGEWRVQWMSGGVTDTVAFTVQPFKLPRFRVDTQADKAFYRPGDKPIVRGAVIYSSGAPVARAQVDIAWQIDGSWPAPLDWQDKLLPKHATTNATGRFELALPEIPKDLQGVVTLTAQLAAVDPAGDRVASATRVLLSEDGIAADAVTELGDGLVQGFNNRLFVRVATPDGRVLPGAKIKVRRAWLASDPGVVAESDEDGVASLQIDPGAPVNIVIPPAPFRPQARPPLVTRGEVQELIAGEPALADEEEMDRWLPALARCAKWSDGPADGSLGGDGYGGARIGMRVDPSGAIVEVGGGATPLSRCAADVIRQRHLARGSDRMYAVQFGFGDPDLPRLATNVESVLDVPAGLAEQVETIAHGARDCLPSNATAELSRALVWKATAGKKDVELRGWIATPSDDGGSAAALGCVMSRFSGPIHLAEPATADSLGLVRFTLELPERLEQQRPQATTMLGYELLVETELGGKPQTTKLRIAPGVVPELRMRVSPVLANPGDPVTAELIRGPSFTGKLPEELVLTCLRSHDKAKLGADHKAKLAIAKGTEGWCEVSGGGAHALVYVRPAGELEVSVKTKDRYKPGDQAQLQIQTTLGGHGGRAAVGLFGVDESLGQLVTLPGADDMGRVRPQVATTSPAFGVLDGQALALGRIRGANAAAATVMRVASLPAPPELDAEVSAAGETQFDPNIELTDHFYGVLAELHAQTRAWEASAPPGEKLVPATMAKLWATALRVCEQRGDAVTDAYGRKLRLSQLPPDLLALTDPRAVVVDGTRLPEDVENWAAWVAKERP